jgi:hypothetical protein
MDHHPLFHGWSDCMGSCSNRQSLYRAWSDRLDVRSNYHQRPAVERGAPTVVRAWERHRESHPV